MNTSPDLERPRAARARMLLVSLTLALSFLGLPRPAVAGPADDASYAVALINDTRWAHGLSGLMPDRELQIIANRHANRMAEAGYIFHSGDLGGRLSWGWWAWAENVGYGPSVG